MVSGNRQTILENNRSLRNIKSELETLLERGILNDDAFDKIHALLPTESPLSGAPTPAPRQHGHPTPAPTQPLAALSLDAAANSAPPPSYAQTTGNAAPPPLPTRKQSQQPPAKPVLCHARALYKYDASDARDCTLEKGDRVAVHERMNADWWMGKNLRSGQEGIFPKAYVEEESGSEKAAAAGYGAQQTAAGGHFPPPPQGRNPYDSSAPPMSMANQGYGGGGGGNEGPKEDSTGKKMGKKFGNAAMFGAGATFGGKIINSIF